MDTYIQTIHLLAKKQAQEREEKAMRRAFLELKGWEIRGAVCELWNEDWRILTTKSPAGFRSWFTLEEAYAYEIGELEAEFV
jgi:hypothetical protein